MVLIIFSFYKFTKKHCLFLHEKIYAVFNSIIDKFLPQQRKLSLNKSSRLINITAVY